MPVILSEKAAIESLIVETRNELTKCEIFDRLQQRELLKAHHVERNQQFMAANQQKMTVLRETLKNLLDLLVSASEENPLAHVKQLEYLEKRPEKGTT